MKHRFNTALFMLIAVLVSLLVFPSNSVADVRSVDTPSPFHRFHINESQIIEFNIETENLDRLTADEQIEQLRDWLLFTVASDSGISPEAINAALFDLPTIRYDYLQPIGSFEFGETRSMAIGNGQVIALLPAGADSDQRLRQLADIGDRQRKNLGKIPSLFWIFEYAIDSEEKLAVLTRRDVLEGARVFTVEFGYKEMTINGQADLQKFIELVDDLSHVQITNGRLTLGGRILSDSTNALVTEEDVATLWQAHSKILSGRSTVGGIGFSLDPFYDYKGLSQYFAKYKSQYLGIVGELALPSSSDELAAVIAGEVESLDPAIECLSKELRAYRGKITVNERTGMPFSEQYLRMIESGLNDENELPLICLGGLMAQSTESRAYSYGRDLLNVLREEYQYQGARYDGDIQGTEVAMTLFYTDLVAKLWGFNYRDSAPEHIDGFIAQPNRQLPALYRQEILELSNTRLWFGPRVEGFQTIGDSKELLFDRLSTRIFSASASNYAPGEEVEPNMSSYVFLKWWNDHYQQVALYDRQYQRLNQIMKWSLLISWLGNIDQGGQLGFLTRVEVDRSNLFPAWVQAHPELRYQNWKGMFKGEQFLARPTESMPILVSEPFHLFVDEANVEWALSGGVSLADVSLFQKMVPLSKQVNEPIRRSYISYDSHLLDAKTRHTLDEASISASYQFLADGRTIEAKADPEISNLRGLTGRLSNSLFRRTVTQNSTEQKLEFVTQFAGAPFSTLEIAKTSNGFGLGWQARDMDRGEMIARSLTQSKDPLKTLIGEPTVRTILDLGNSNFYVQMEGSQGWLKSFSGGGEAGLNVPAGWNAQIVDSGGQDNHYLLAWVGNSDLAVQIDEESYVAISMQLESQKTILTANGIRGPPTGRKAIEIKVGDRLVPAFEEPSSGTLYIQWKYLSNDLGENLGNLSDILRYGDSASTMAQFRQLLEDGDRSNFVREMTAAPVEAHASAQEYLDERLQYFKLLVDGNQPVTAIQSLENLILLYGPQPKFYLLKARTQADQGQMKRRALTQDSADLRQTPPSDSKNILLNEISQRVSFKEVKEQALKGASAVYVIADRPGLDNAHFSPALETTLNAAYESGVVEFDRIESPEIAENNPSEVWVEDTAGNTIKLRLLKPSSVAIVVASLVLGASGAGPSCPDSSGQDECDVESNPNWIYIVVPVE